MPTTRATAATMTTTTSDDIGRTPRVRSYPRRLLRQVIPGVEGVRVVFLSQHQGPLTLSLAPEIPPRSISRWTVSSELMAGRVEDCTLGRPDEDLLCQRPRDSHRAGGTSRSRTPMLRLRRLGPR